MPLESRTGTQSGRLSEALSMNDVTRILSAVEKGEAGAAEQLLPLIYAELRKLAAQMLAQEKPGQTLQATALVHEAYLRLVGTADPGWDSRGHFFAAAAEAMRRILIENARRKQAEKHGGSRRRVELDDADVATRSGSDELLELDDLLSVLAQEDPDAAQLVKLRLFAGLSVEGAAEVLRISRSGAYQQWTYARAWLNARLRGEEPPGDT
jgi:RNA polymerase sigma factor (TIGR02999 family)